MSDYLWLLGFMWAMSFMGVGAWWLWYAVVRVNQRARHKREVQLAASQGLPPPIAPSPPKVLHFLLRVSATGAVLGVVGAGMPLLTIALGK